jgi:small GTP-binding protein
MEPNYDKLVKLLIIGDSAVGKTSILIRFTDDEFSTSHLATVGIDIKNKTFELDRDVVKLQIWDSAGQERFHSIASSFYKGAMGILLVYDCTNEDSFRNVGKWLHSIQTHGSDNVQKVLIGNKCDMPSRTVSTAVGERMAKEAGLKLFETSAKTNINIHEAFYYISRQVILNYASYQVPAPPLRLGQRSQRRKKCCKKQ